MSRSYAMTVLILFIVIPKYARCFFTQPVPDVVQATGQLHCYLESAESADSDFQLCAIRVYTPWNGTSTESAAIVQNGMWFSNVFRRLIATRNCQGFTQTADIGTGNCSVMPYEEAEGMTLCICATNNCNQNLAMCQSANEEANNIVQLPRFFPTLTTTLECNQTSEISEACFEHSLINQTSCDSYTRSYSVLCTIGATGGEAVQESLLEENYELFLDKKLHGLKPLLQFQPDNLLRDTDSYIYYMYYPDTTGPTEECACTQSAYCNLDIASCAPNSNQTEVATSVAPSSAPTAQMTAESASNMTTERYTTASLAATNSSVGINSSATELPSGTSMVPDLTSATGPTTNFTGTIQTTAVQSGTSVSTQIPSNMTATVPMGTSPTRQIPTEVPTTTAPGLNPNIIIGIVAGVVVLAVFIGAFICCQCCRSNRCKCLRCDRSRAYES